MLRFKLADARTDRIEDAVRELLVGEPPGAEQIGQDPLQAVHQ